MFTKISLMSLLWTILYPCNERPRAFSYKSKISSSELPWILVWWRSAISRCFSRLSILQLSKSSSNSTSLSFNSSLMTSNTSMLLSRLKRRCILVLHWAQRDVWGSSKLLNEENFNLNVKMAENFILSPKWHLSCVWQAEAVR